MGKLLTVESRIKRFGLKSIPLAASKFYSHLNAYEELILTFVEQLIKANEWEFFIQFLED